MMGTPVGGRYLLSELVGNGGSASVWRAYDEVENRPVAVKLVGLPTPEDPYFVKRYVAEARYLLTVRHPGVAQVLDRGEDPFLGAYLVMEFVDGEPLSQRLARVGTLDATHTMELVAQVADALGALHRAGMVHRNVRPRSVLLRPDATVVLAAIGVARPDHLARLTTTADGFSWYGAPEEAMGNVPGTASDIFCLGLVAYECLAGHPPFAGESPLHLALSIVRDPTPPLPPGVPPPVVAVVERALAKQPAQRWPDVGALATAARSAR
jgi:serine/threonine-protein kinase